MFFIGFFSLRPWQWSQDANLRIPVEACWAGEEPLHNIARVWLVQRARWVTLSRQWAPLRLQVTQQCLSQLCDESQVWSIMILDTGPAASNR